MSEALWISILVIKQPVNRNLEMFFHQMHLIGLVCKRQFLVFRGTVVRGIKVFHREILQADDRAYRTS